MDTPVLSVIIPYYKGIKCIADTVEAVRRIDHDKEILIIDDGSCDGSYETLTKLYGTSQDIILFSKPNGGIADSRNYGLNAASGRYVFFCDQDDKAVSGVIDEAIDRADQNGSDIVFWSTEMTYADGRSNRPCDTVTADDTLQGTAIKDGLLKQILTQSGSEYGTRFSHLWMGLFRREFVAEHGIGFKKFISIDDDLIFLMDTVSCAGIIDLIPKTGYLWLQNNYSRSHTVLHTQDFLRKTTEHFDYYETVMERAGCSEDTVRAVRGFTSQAVIADSMVNWSDMPAGPEKRSEKEKITKRLIDTKADRNWDSYHMNDDPRRYKTYRLLHQSRIRTAFAYNQYISLYRRFRHMGRLILIRIGGASKSTSATGAEQ